MNTPKAEETQYQLYIIEKVKRGFERADAEGAVSHEDAKARLSKWLSDYPDFA